MSDVVDEIVEEISQFAETEEVHVVNKRRRIIRARGKNMLMLAVDESLDAGVRPEVHDFKFLPIEEGGSEIVELKV